MFVLGDMANFAMDGPEVEEQWGRGRVDEKPTTILQKRSRFILCIGNDALVLFDTTLACGMLYEI